MRDRKLGQGQSHDPSLLLFKNTSAGGIARQRDQTRIGMTT